MTTAPEVTPDEMVAVPKALLAEVLDRAESDSFSTESEFACCDDDCKAYAAERALITKLRQIAGLEENPEVVGQGFFGIINALQEKSK